MEITFYPPNSPGFSGEYCWQQLAAGGALENDTEKQNDFYYGIYIGRTVGIVNRNETDAFTNKSARTNLPKESCRGWKEQI